MLNQFYSNDLDTLEALAFLGCFKLPESLMAGKLNNSQAVKIWGNLLGKLENYQTGFELKHRFQMQKTKALS